MSVKQTNFASQKRNLFARYGTVFGTPFFSTVVQHYESTLRDLEEYFKL